MRKVLIGICLLVPTIGHSCPSLDGKWQSSLSQFETFNKRWANVEDKAWTFMMQTQGKEIIAYEADKRMVISSPKMELSMGGKKIMRPASQEKIDFTILGCTAKSVVVEYERYGEKEISHLQFVDNNTYWQYMGSPESNGNSHIREYYTKIH